MTSEDVLHFYVYPGAELQVISVLFILIKKNYHQFLILECNFLLFQ